MKLSKEYISIKKNIKIGGMNKMQESDKEYYQEFLRVRELMLKDGWKQVKINRDREIAEVTFSKNGFSIHVMFGCCEKINQEVF